MNGQAAVPVEDLEAAAMWSGDPGEGNRLDTAYNYARFYCILLLVTY